MAITRLRANSVVFIIRNAQRRLSTQLIESEYTDTPEYPPILDLSREAKKQRTVSNWHEKIKCLQTVEEKLIEINMPKYYGWKSVLLTEGTIKYNSLNFTQHITRTHLNEIQDLPSYYTTSGLIDLSTTLIDRLKSQIENVIAFEYKYRRRKHEYLKGEDNYLSPSQLDDIIGKNVLQQINHTILTNLSSEFPHLLQSQIEEDPRLESFWFVGGIESPNRSRKSRQNREDLKERANEPVERAVQYLGSPQLHLRHELPLPPVVELEESYNSNLTIPHFQYDPRVLSYMNEHRHGTNIPGFWPGDPCEFGLLSFHRRGHLLDRPESYGDADRAESLHVQAILASYGWLLPQACYQGFSTFNDLTYPLVTQTVISNGQYWSFYVYQLNTTLVHSKYATENPRCNLCWGTDALKLFDSVEDDKVIGFNEDVLKKLLSFYLNTPKQREGIEMKPYLGKEVKLVADITEDERRAWLEKCFKHMYANRPRHRLIPEVYNWERIYKIDHKTRPLDARRRPFELEINPFKRRYDEHHPEYIPKVHRAEKRFKKKWASTYYP